MGSAGTGKGAEGEGTLYRDHWPDISRASTGGISEQKKRN